MYKTCGHTHVNTQSNISAILYSWEVTKIQSFKKSSKVSTLNGNWVNLPGSSATCFVKVFFFVREESKSEKSWRAAWHS